MCLDAFCSPNVGHVIWMMSLTIPVQTDAFQQLHTNSRTKHSTIGILTLHLTQYLVCQMTGGIIVPTSTFLAFSISTVNRRLFKIEENIYTLIIKKSETICKKIISAFSRTCIEVV